MRQQHATPTSKLRGHYQYYGIRANFRGLSNLVYQVERIWKTWLGRRSQRAPLSWQQYKGLLR